MRNATDLDRGLLLCLGIICCACGVDAMRAESPSSEPPTRQAIVWTSGDPDVAHRMTLMYAHAAQKNGWFDDVQLIVWGPSSRLLAGDKDLQAKIREMLDDGVDVKACIVCADLYGVTENLRELGIEVRPMGQPLAELQLQGWHVLTF